MDYAPEKNNIKILIMLGLLLFDLIIFALFSISTSMSIKGLLVFLFLLLNIYGTYILVLLMTLKFRLTEQQFTISGAFDIKKIQIPLSEIQSWSRRITLLENVGTNLHTARFALGKGLDSNGESADLFITSSKKAVFLKTNQGNYGISPEEADAFVDQLKELGIPQRTGTERAYLNTDNNEGRAPMNQLTRYCILLTVILLVLPVVMYFLNLLPEWVPTSMNQYITQKAYLESVIFRGLLALVTIMVTYGIIFLISSIEGKFYYRIMFVPLVFVVVLLFLEINTHLNILLNF